MSPEFEEYLKQFPEDIQALMREFTPNTKFVGINYPEDQRAMYVTGVMEDTSDKREHEILISKIDPNVDYDAATEDAVPIPVGDLRKMMMRMQ